MSKFAVSLFVVSLIAGVASAAPLFTQDFSTNVLVNTDSGTYVPPSTVGQWLAPTGVWQWNSSAQAAESAQASPSGLWYGFDNPQAGNYTLKFDYSGTGGQVRVFESGGVNWFTLDNLNTMGDLTQLTEQDLADASGMTTVSVPFTADSPTGSSANPYLWISFTQQNNSGMMVDNVSVVPEPITMSLLGLGGLALLRRRRR